MTSPERGGGHLTDWLRMKMKKPYCQVTAMSQGDNKGLETMAGAGLCFDFCDQGQIDMGKPPSQDWSPSGWHEIQRPIWCHFLGLLYLGNTIQTRPSRGHNCCFSIDFFLYFHIGGTVIGSRLKGIFRHELKYGKVLGSVLLRLLANTFNNIKVTRPAVL